MAQVRAIWSRAAVTAERDCDDRTGMTTNNGRRRAELRQLKSGMTDECLVHNAKPIGKLAIGPSLFGWRLT